MVLNDQQIEFIRQDIRSRGVTIDELADSLLDHICCAMENDSGSDFDENYRRVISTFGEGGFHQIQQETIVLLTIKKEVAMKKTMYILGYIAAILMTTGLLFKIQHWPGAAVMLTLGIALLNFGFLPMFFYDKYRNAAGAMRN